MEERARCECGDDRAACAAAWDASLALEFRDPEYGAVHHLTVAAFMLQHGSRLSAEGWVAMRDRLRRFIVEGETPERARREAVRHPRAPESGSLTRARERGPSGLQWSHAIAGVRRDDGATYRADVASWAASTLAEAEAFDSRRGAP
ncbi:MAG: DUF5946 family protein [Dehalococcoidia bacterium]